MITNLRMDFFQALVMTVSGFLLFESTCHHTKLQPHPMYPGPSCDPCPIADTEYEEPGGLQEKLQRLNTMMGGTGAEHARRMQYLTHCEYTLG